MWLDHKPVILVIFFIEIYTSNKLSIDVWFVMIGQYLAAIQLYSCTTAVAYVFWAKIHSLL